ncbi:MAG TPA: adenylate kinase [Candidatus Dormibacteraeota bacterium]|jgi:adenylate kinase
MIGIIFGPPGSGKGTQASRIERGLHLEHLSTGELLRAEVAGGTPIGERVKQIMAAGDLVPDGLIVDMVRSRLPAAERGEGVLLDGFPRTVAQAEALDAMLAEEGHGVGFVLALTVPEDVLVDRILHRAAQEGRTDDTRQAVAERMREYHHRTEPVLERYRQQGVRVLEVDGLGTPDEVFQRIQGALTRGKPGP